MVKETKFFRKQATRAETAARTASDEEVSQGLLAMALGYRRQAELLKKKQKAGKKHKTKPKHKKAPKPKGRKTPNKARRPGKKGKRKRRS
jgi:hypothetical protein